MAPPRVHYRLGFHIVVAVALAGAIAWLLIVGPKAGAYSRPCGFRGRLFCELGASFKGYEVLGYNPVTWALIALLFFSFYCVMARVVLRTAILPVDGELEIRRIFKQERVERDKIADVTHVSRKLGLDSRLKVRFANGTQLDLAAVSEVDAANFVDWFNHR